MDRLLAIVFGFEALGVRRVLVLLINELHFVSRIVNAGLIRLPIEITRSLFLYRSG